MIDVLEFVVFVKGLCLCWFMGVMMMPDGVMGFILSSILPSIRLNFATSSTAIRRYLFHYLVFCFLLSNVLKIELMIESKELSIYNSLVRLMIEPWLNR